MDTFIAATLAVAIALEPLAADASEPAPAPAPSAEEDSALVLARAMFDRGAASYEAEDYAEAIKQWTMAHDLMAGAPAMLGARNVLAFDLGQAHMRAYDRDGDPGHLTAAEPLLESYVAWVDRPGHTMSEAEREDRPRAIEMLARIAIARGPVPRASVSPAIAPAAAPPPEPTPAPRRKGTGLIVGGSLSLGGAIGFAVLAGVATVRGRKAEEDYVMAVENDDEIARQQADFDGKQANTIFIASVTSSVVLGLTGAGLLAGGIVRRKRWLAAHPVAVHPIASPSMAGLGMHGRF